MLASFLAASSSSDKERIVKAAFRILLLLCPAATAQAQIVDDGLIQQHAVGKHDRPARMLLR